MRAYPLLLLIPALVIGCGEPEGEITLIPDPLVSVIDSSGEKRKIPSAELYDSMGRPTVERVLVIDRARNQQLYVKLDELSTDSQAESHYMLVTEAPLVTPPTADDHR